MPLNCTDPDGFDAAPLYARARGEQLDEATEEALEAHLDRCPACRAFEGELVVTYAEHERRDPVEMAETMQALLLAASSAPLNQAPPPQGRSASRQGWLLMSGIGALAAAVTLTAIVFQGHTSGAPPAAGIALDGMAKRTLGSHERQREAEIPTFAPDGRIEVSVQLEAQLEAGAPTPRLLLFVERDGKLARIDEAALERGGDEGWPTLSGEVPVAEVLGRAPGVHRLWFGSSFELDAAALDGRPVRDARADARVTLKPQPVEVLDPGRPPPPANAQ